MGKNDNRRSLKMRQRKSRASKQLRIKRRAVAYLFFHPDILFNFMKWHMTRAFYHDRNIPVPAFLDKLSGGIGIRRGRTNLHEIHAGDALDFWRVLLADKEKRRLLLYAEMRLPGEAWLEFSMKEDNTLRQVATYRPKGVLGRWYWYLLMPFHIFIFKGMAKRIVRI